MDKELSEAVQQGKERFKDALDTVIKSYSAPWLNRAECMQFCERLQKLKEKL